MLGEWGSLGKGDLGRQRLKGQEKRGEGALPPEPEVLLSKQTAQHVKEELAGAGRCEGCPRGGDFEVVETEIFCENLG